MKWTRRQILFALGGAAFALGLGAWSGQSLRGRLSFADWRALPVMTLNEGLLKHIFKNTLGLDIETDDDPRAWAIDIIAIDERGEHRLSTVQGARHLDIEMPYIPTKNESFVLVAQARDWRHRRLRSEPVEVLANSYRFGL